MTGQTIEDLRTSASVDDAFWDLVLADPELAAAEFTALTEPDFPPPGDLPPADGSPRSGPWPTIRSTPPPSRLGAIDSRTVPTKASGTVRSPPPLTHGRTAGVGRRRP